MQTTAQQADGACAGSWLRRCLPILPTPPRPRSQILLMPREAVASPRTRSPELRGRLGTRHCPVPVSDLPAPLTIGGMGRK